MRPEVIEEEERKLELAIEETEKQCAQVTAELEKLELKSSRFNELEERYWHEFNNFQFQLISHQRRDRETKAHERYMRLQEQGKTE
ncbi:hypothetical protein ACSBR2_041545 [Camellia fascicularis]